VLARPPETRRLPDLGAPPAGDPADADRLRGLVAATSRWCLQCYLPSAVDAAGALVGAEAASGRSTSGAALSLAVALRCRALDEAVRPDAAEQGAVLAVRACAAGHISAGGQWGRSWQSPLASGQLGLAALVLGDALPTDVRAAVDRVAQDEAGFLAGVPVHYLRDVSGDYLTQGDTGAEEESWRARGLSAALALLPGDLHAPRWHHALVLRALAAYAPPADVHSAELLHRSPLCSWLAGSNLEPNGDLQNHLVNPQPNYMRPVHHVAATMNQRMAGQPVSPSLLRNLDLMYAALRRLYTEDGGLHYPQGTDVRSRAVVLYANDVQHRALGIAPEQALRWERLHGRIAEGQVQPDGRVEEPGGTEPFGPVHPDIATKLAEALLALVLGPPRPEQIDGTTLAGAPVQQRQVACPAYGPTFHDAAGAMLVAARWVASRDVLAGYDDGAFRPGDPVTRATAVLSLWRAAGSPGSPAPHGFDDVATDGGPLDRAVRWARATDVVAGATRTRLEADETLTRGQAVVLLWRAAGAPEAPDSGFDDVKGETAEAAGWARALGVTTGTTATTFGPATLVNRGQWAVMLHRQHTA
jgi:hypothetical protein